MSFARAPYLITFFLPMVLLATLLLARQDYLRQLDHEEEIHRLAQTVAWEAQALAVGQADLDLVRFNYYPTIEAVRITGADGQFLFQFPKEGGPTDSPELLVVREEIAGNQGWVEIRARSLGWQALSKELPILILVLFLFNWLTTLKRQPESPTESNLLAATQDLTPDEDPQGSEVFRHLVMELDSDLVVRSVSRGSKSYGFASEDLIGKPIGSLLNRFEPQSSSESTTLVDKDGVTLDSIFSSTPIRNQEGKLERVVVTVKDSLDEHEYLAQRFAKLQQILESICEHAEETILLVSPGRRLVYSNPIFGKVVQAERDTLIGSELLEWVDPSCRVQAADALHRALEGEEKVPLELRVSSSEGVHSLVGAFHPVRPREGAPRSVVGIFRDVTDERRLTTELKLSEERYRHTQKMDALGRLAGGVAHDFNNLLTIFSMNLSILNEKIQSGEQEQAKISLEELDFAAQRASALTKQLLLFSRKTPSSASLVASQPLLERVAQMTSRILGPGINLHIDLQAQQDQISIDPGQLEQIVLNLLVNAKDALPDGGTITVRTSNLTLQSKNALGLSAGEYLTIRVKDDGVGIPAHVLPKVLEPYFTTKGVGEGTGLGLSTVAAIVEKASGHLSIESKVDKGTEITVMLPIVTQENALPSADPNSDAVPQNGSSQKERILLVEDEGSIRRAVAALLEKKGYRVTVAEDGNQGRDLIVGQAGEFDLLLTDLVLPGCSGSDLAADFVARSGQQKPVLFMSGYPADTLDSREVLSHCKFLAKPFSPDQLFHDISDLLDSATV